MATENQLDQALASGWDETSEWLIRSARVPDDLSAGQWTRLLGVAGEDSQRLQLLADCIEAKHHHLSTEQHKAVIDFVGADVKRIQWVAGWLGQGADLDVHTRIGFISQLLHQQNPPDVAGQRAILHLCGLPPVTGDLRQWMPRAQELATFSHVLAALSEDDHRRLERAIEDSSTFTPKKAGKLDREDFPLRGQLLLALAALQKSATVPDSLKAQLHSIFGASQSVNFSTLS